MSNERTLSERSGIIRRATQGIVGKEEIFPITNDKGFNNYCDDRVVNVVILSTQRKRCALGVYDFLLVAQVELGVPPARMVHLQD